MGAGTAACTSLSRCFIQPWHKTKIFLSLHNFRQMQRKPVSRADFRGWTRHVAKFSSKDCRRRRTSKKKMEDKKSRQLADRNLIKDKEIKKVKELIKETHNRLTTLNQGQALEIKKMNKVLASWFSLFLCGSVLTILLLSVILYRQHGKLRRLEGQCKEYKTMIKFLQMWRNDVTKQLIESKGKL